MICLRQHFPKTSLEPSWDRAQVARYLASAKTTVDVATSWEVWEEGRIVMILNIASATMRQATRFDMRACDRRDLLLISAKLQRLAQEA